MSKLSDHQNINDWNGGKSEDEWIVEFVESNTEVFHQYLFWREIQGRIERIEDVGDIEDTSYELEN